MDYIDIRFFLTLYILWSYCIKSCEKYLRTFPGGHHEYKLKTLFFHLFLISLSLFFSQIFLLSLSLSLSLSLCHSLSLSLSISSSLVTLPLPIISSNPPPSSLLLRPSLPAILYEDSPLCGPLIEQLGHQMLKKNLADEAVKILLPRNDTANLGNQLRQIKTLTRSEYNSKTPRLHDKGLFVNDVSLKGGKGCVFWPTGPKLTPRRRY